MEIKNIQDLISIGGQTLKNFLTKFYALIITPNNFLNSLKHDTTDELLNASKFSFFIIIINLSIISPLYRTMGIKIESTSYLLTHTILTFSIWMLYAIIFHLIAKVFRGTALLQSTMCIFLYLSAFFPIIRILSLPITKLSMDMIVSNNPIQFEFYIIFFKTLLNSSVLIGSFVLHIIGLLWYSICTIIGIKIINNFNYVKSSIVFFIGFIGWQLLSYSISIHAIQILLKAYIK